MDALGTMGCRIFLIFASPLPANLKFFDRETSAGSGAALYKFASAKREWLVVGGKSS
jgi:hypothetical protein